MAEQIRVLGLIAARIFGRWTPDALGLSDSSAANNAAVLAAATGTVVLTPGVWPVNTCVIAADLVVERGAMLKPLAGQAVTISGAVRAGAFKWIDLSLGGTVTITSPVAQVRWSDGATALTLKGYGIAVSDALLPFELTASCEGVPGASLVVLRRTTVAPFTLPIALAGSRVKAGAAATGATVLSVQKNGVEIGTLTVGAGETTAVGASAAGAAFAAGDVLTVVCPAIADGTFASFGVTLKATLV